MSTLQGGPGSIVTDGLVLYLDAGNYLSYPGSGTTWTDLSSGGSNGTLTNGPTYSPDNAGSIVFDGVDDYVDCGNPTFLNNLPQSALSAFAWVNPTSTGDNGTGRIFDKREGITYKGWLLFMDETSTIGAQVLNTVDILSANSRGVDNTITLQNWNYVGFTYDYNGDKKARLYVNGSEIEYETQTSSSNQPSDDSGGNMLIGDDNILTRSYNGKISITQIYNRALTASEVLQNYNSTKGRFGL